MLEEDYNEFLTDPEFTTLMYQRQMADCVTKLVKHLFPKVKNLDVNYQEDGQLLISCDDDGTYSKEEIESSLASVKKAFKITSDPGKSMQELLDLVK